MPSRRMLNRCGKPHRTAVPARFWFTSATMRSGLIGASLRLTPNGASAFSTAPMMAAIAAMVPPSPAPLSPSGLSGDGVSVWVMAIGGMSAAPAPPYALALARSGAGARRGSRFDLRRRQDVAEDFGSEAHFGAGSRLDYHRGARAKGFHVLHRLDQSQATPRGAARPVGDQNAVGV
jgi:hypothetical protein